MFSSDHHVECITCVCNILLLLIMVNRIHGGKLAIAQVCSQKCISDVSTLHHIVICGRAIYLKWSVKEFIKDIVAVISQILIKDYKKITKAVVATRESEKLVRVTSDGLLVCTSDKFNGPVIKKFQSL